MKLVPDLVDLVKETKGGRPAVGRGDLRTARVDVAHKEQHTVEATCRSGDKEFRLLIDEPEARGGLGRAPGALQLWLAGAGG